MVDRNRFNRGASMSKLKDIEKDAQSNNKTPFYDSGKFLNFHSIEEGTNKFRILPAHDPDDSPYIAQRSSLLNVMVDEYKDGEKTGDKIRKLKKVFVATQHGPRDEDGQPIIDKDPIEMYIDYLKKSKKDQGLSDKEIEKELQPVLRGFRNEGKWIWGIQPSTSYVCVAVDMNTKKMGRLELSNKQYKDLQKLCIAEADDSEIASDIFSPVDEGYPLEITKTKSNSKTEYTIGKTIPKRNESWEEFFGRVAVTDKVLEELLEKYSLKFLYWESYTSRDFQFAIDGLRYVDEKNKFDIFKNSEFIKELSEIEKLVPEFVPEKNDDDDETSEKETKKETAAENKVPETDISETLKNKKPSKPAMKRFLKAYIKESYGDEYVLPEDISAEDLEEWYHLAEAGEYLPFDKEEESCDAQPETEKAVEETVEEKGEMADDDVMAQIRALKAKRGRK